MVINLLFSVVGVKGKIYGSRDRLLSVFGTTVWFGVGVATRFGV